MQQGVHVAIDVAAIILLHCPALHDVQAGAPMPLQNPAAQGVHVVFKNAPIVVLQVPAGQPVGFKESKGQKEPAGQITGVPDTQK